MAAPSSMSSLGKEFTGLFATRARAVASILVDLLFLLLWVIGQWLFLAATAGITLAGAEDWALPIAQGVFALSTLVPILLYIFWDLRILYLQGQVALGGGRQAYARDDTRAAELTPTLAVALDEHAPGDLGSDSSAERGVTR